MDYINQSIIQISQEPDSERSDKTDFAEKLGSLNQRWQSLNNQVHERLKNLELLLKNWQDYEKTVKDLLRWYEQQEARIKRYDGKIGHEIGVQHALKDCQVVEELVESKDHELEMMEKSGLNLTSRIHVQQTIEEIQEAKEKLLEKVSDLHSKLTGIAETWKQYHEALHVVTKCLSGAEYTLGKFKTIGGRLDSFRLSLYKVKGVQTEFQDNRIHLTTLKNLTYQMIQVCEPSVSSGLERTISDIGNRWKAVDEQLGVTLNMFEQALLHWEQYEEEYRKVAEWIAEKERQVEDVLLAAADKDWDADKEEQLSSAKELLQDLESYHCVSGLTSLIDPLTRHMDTTTIVTITSQQKSLQQKIDSMRQAIGKQVQNMENYILSQGKFQDALLALTSWLGDMEGVISKEDPNRSAEEYAIRERMDELKVRQHLSLIILYCCIFLMWVQLIKIKIF